MATISFFRTGSLPSQIATTFWVHAESFRVCTAKFADLLSANADPDEAFADSPAKMASPTGFVTTKTGIDRPAASLSFSGNRPPARPAEFRIPAQFAIACGGAITMIPAAPFCVAYVTGSAHSSPAGPFVSSCDTPLGRGEMVRWANADGASTTILPVTSTPEKASMPFDLTIQPSFAKTIGALALPLPKTRK